MEKLHDDGKSQRNYVSWCCRIMYHRSSSCVVSRWWCSTCTHTHSLRRRMKLFQSNLEKVKNIISYWFSILIFLSFLLRSPTCLTNIAYLTARRSNFASIDHSLMLTTRLTYEAYSRCTLSICCFLQAPRTQKALTTMYVCENENFSFFFSINNITSLIPFLTSILNTHNLPTTVIWGFVDFSSSSSLPLSTQAGKRVSEWETY